MTRHCTGVILAGGNASRFSGRAKGLLLVDGEPIVVRVARALEAASDALVLSSGARLDATMLPGVPRVHDQVSDAGPLAGIHAALAHSGGDLLVCAWDMPHVSADLLRELRRLGESGAGRDAVIPVGDHAGRGEPLCAWYARTLVGVIGAQLRSDPPRSILDVLRNRDVLLLDYVRVRQFGDPAILFANVNTPADLTSAQSSSS